MKTSTEAKKITKEIAELLPEVPTDVKEDMLIILKWENMKKSNETDCEVVMNEIPKANNEKD